jgi:hypothetical protein
VRRRQHDKEVSADILTILAPFGLYSILDGQMLISMSFPFILGVCHSVLQAIQHAKHVEERGYAGNSGCFADAKTSNINKRKVGKR